MTLFQRSDWMHSDHTFDDTYGIVESSFEQLEMQNAELKAMIVELLMKNQTLRLKLSTLDARMEA